MGSKRAWLVDALGWLTLASLLVALYLVFIWVPTEKQMGVVQRIFYFHLPFAGVAFVSFFVVFVASILWLVKARPKWDMLAVAAAEIGLVFCTLVLITGSIWAKPMWGTWWTWDPRLTTTLVLWLIYVSYFMLRAAVSEPFQRARLAAVVGIVGFIDVPIVFMSIRWWRTIHPVVVTSESIAMDPPMILTLVVSFVGMFLLYAYVFVHRFQLERLRNEVEDLKEEFTG